MKQYYKIKEISKLYNIGPDSLRYYEKLGLLTPKRSESGYRLYGLQDLWRLNVIRDLRHLGFPMEKIKDYLKHRSIKDTRALLDDEISAIDREICALQKLRQNVSQRLKTLNLAEQMKTGSVNVRRFPERRCYIISQPFCLDEEMDFIIKQLLNKDKNNLYIIGSNQISGMMSLKQARSGNYADYEGALILHENGDACIPEGEYLSVAYRGDAHQYETYFPMLEQYAASHHLTLMGSIYEFLWVDIHQAANACEHLTELQVRVGSQD